MSLYSGTKSLDAEITIDFSTSPATVKMDYSKNDLALPYDSNRSAVLTSRYYSELGLLKTTFLVIVQTAVALGRIFPLTIGMEIFKYIAEITQSEAIHYHYQKCIRFIALYGGRGGYYEISKIVDGESCVIHASTNVFIQYSLSSGTSRCIKKIHVVRSFEIFYPLGNDFQELRQNGWDVIFEFWERPPPDSVVSVKYIP